MLGLPPLPEPCTIPQDLLRSVPETTAQNLRARYQTALTHVVFVVAPMPACNKSSQLAGRRFDTLEAAPIQLLPPANFKQDLAFVHLRPDAVPANTAHLTELLRARLP